MCYLDLFVLVSSYYDMSQTLYDQAVGESEFLLLLCVEIKIELLMSHWLFEFFVALVDCVRIHEYSEVLV